MKKSICIKWKQNLYQLEKMKEKRRYKNDDNYEINRCEKEK